MSNVLIGIIGVILFIGLALAGALILGEDFKTARTEASIATLQTQGKQMVDAVSMRRLKTGSTIPSGNLSDYTPRFLKSVSPTLPERSTQLPFLVDSEGNLNGPAAFLVIPVGSDVAFCRNVSLSTGFIVDGGGTHPAYISSMPQAPHVSSGCFHRNGTAPANIMTAVNSQFFYFMRL